MKQEAVPCVILDTAELLLLLWHCVYFAVNLMGLLKWRDNPKDLERYLRLFMKVDGEEIVKVEFFGAISWEMIQFAQLKSSITTITIITQGV